MYRNVCGQDDFVGAQRNRLEHGVLIVGLHVAVQHVDAEASGGQRAATAEQFVLFQDVVVPGQEDQNAAGAELGADIADDVED